MGIAMKAMMFGMRLRLGSERGQTAAEYMGVLVLVALVIVALTTLGIGDQIAERIRSVVQTVSEGGATGPTVTTP